MCKGQLKVLHNLLPASSGVERGAGGGGSCGGPGQAGLSFIFLIGSQWGIQDFHRGGGPPKRKFGLATLGMILL